MWYLFPCKLAYISIPDLARKPHQNAPRVTHLQILKRLSTAKIRFQANMSNRRFHNYTARYHHGVCKNVSSLTKGLNNLGITEMPLIINKVANWKQELFLHGFHVAFSIKILVEENFIPRIAYIRDHHLYRFETKSSASFKRSFKTAYVFCI